MNTNRQEHTMRRLTLTATAVLTAATIAACSNDGPTTTSEEIDDDYALVMFGVAGAALESSLGPQGGRPFDGRTAAVGLPPSLALTEEQRAEIAALREAFRAEHQETLAALRAIFEEARAAREAGATRDEVRAILEGARQLAQELRPDVEALHAAVLAVLTDEQVAWIEEHRRRPPPGLGPRHGTQRRGPPSR
jgi:Spy/CpxP family protein refolding chaperone